VKRLWSEGLRDLFPWIVGGALAWLLLVWWIPDTVCRFRQLREQTTHLNQVAPRPEVLRQRLARAVADSQARASLRAIAARRQASGSDPSSQVASLVVPLLEGRGVRLQKVSAREEGREVLLSLAVQASWKELLDGFAALDSLPLKWTTRRLLVRPVDGSRLGGDLVIGVPAMPSEAAP